MDWEVVPRIGSVAGKVALAVVLLELLARNRGRLPRHLLSVWLAFGAYALALGLQGLALEGLALGAALDPGRAEALRAVRRGVYDFTYLTFATLGALLPAAVLLLVGRARWMRQGGVALGALALGIAGASALGGVPGAWRPLLTATRALALLAIVAYLSFWAGLLLGQMLPVDGYFTAFYGARTLFVLLLPIQEGLFALLGRTGAEPLWSVHLSLQTLLYLFQAAVVVRLSTLLAGGRIPRPLALG